MVGIQDITFITLRVITPLAIVPRQQRDDLPFLPAMPWYLNSQVIIQIKDESPKERRRLRREPWKGKEDEPTRILLRRHTPGEGPKIKFSHCPSALPWSVVGQADLKLTKDRWPSIYELTEWPSRHSVQYFNERNPRKERSNFRIKPFSRRNKGLGHNHKINPLASGDVP